MPKLIESAWHRCPQMVVPANAGEIQISETADSPLPPAAAIGYQARSVAEQLNW